MQITSVPEKTNQWRATAVTTFLILLAVLLFGWAISRMGLLNGVRATAVTPQALPFTAQAMRFGPEILTVKAGEEVTVVLDNHDLYEHSFDVDALDLHVALPPNGRTEFTFIAPQAGTYTLYCAVLGHREAGMESTLVVAE